MRRIHADMATVSFAPASFDAVTAVYSLFRNIHTWLRPGGKLLFTYASHHHIGAETFNGDIEFMGRPLYYSNDPPQQLRDMLANAGFGIEDETWRDLGVDDGSMVVAEYATGD